MGKYVTEVLNKFDSFKYLPKVISSISLFKFEGSQNKENSTKIEGFINHEELV